MTTTNPPSVYSPLVLQRLVFSPPGGAGASSCSASGFLPNPTSPSAAPGGHQAPTGDPSSGSVSVIGIIPGNWKALVLLAEAHAGIAPAEEGKRSPSDPAERWRLALQEITRWQEDCVAQPALGNDGSDGKLSQPSANVRQASSVPCTEHGCLQPAVHHCSSCFD